MFTDDQVMIRPTCGCCTKAPALFFWRSTAVCGDCGVKLNNRERDRQLAIIEEVRKSG